MSDIQPPVNNMDRTVSALRQNLNAINGERTYIDKMLGKEDIKQLEGAMLSKKVYTREDVNKMQFLLNGSELKLANLGKDQRYIHNKFYCWIEEVMAIYCLMLDYTADEDGDYKRLSPQDQKLYNDSLSLYTSAIKQLAYLYFHLARSSLSLSGWGIGKMLDAKVEYVYNQDIRTQNFEPERKKFLGMF